MGFLEEIRQGFVGLGKRYECRGIWKKIKKF
jgi:hypothetical protein